MNKKTNLIWIDLEMTGLVPEKDIISLNAGAAIYVSGLTTSLQSGVDRANQLLSDGSAQQKLADYVKASNS